MTYFAQVKDGHVQQVIVADQEFIDSGAVGTPSEWISSPRKKPAAPGDSYRADIDAFVGPQPFPSWILDTDTAVWQPPTAKPEGAWLWNESNLTWEKFNGMA